MILGYVLICGMGPMEVGAIDGCRLFTMQFADMVTCEAERQGFLDEPNLREYHYVDDSGCFVVGTGV
jgi:hypothetical protein